MVWPINCFGRYSSSTGCLETGQILSTKKEVVLDLAFWLIIIGLLGRATL